MECPMRLQCWNAGKEATGANEASLCFMQWQSFSIWSFHRGYFELPHSLVARRQLDCWHGSQARAWCDSSKEGGRRCLAFYNLGLKIMLHHFHWSMGHGG